MQYRFCQRSTEAPTSRFLSLSGFTIGELLVAASIAIIVIGGAFSLWLMTQQVWKNERTKSKMLQDLQITIERIKREMQLSDGTKILFHTAYDGTYDAISFPLALDDGRSDTGYNLIEKGDGFLETDSTTYDNATETAKIFWDKTIIYFVYNNAEKNTSELRRVVFYPRDNSLTTEERQFQLDQVVALGAGNNAIVPNYANCQNEPEGFRAMFTGNPNSISLKMSPQLREFDGYSALTERTESLIDFGSAIIGPGYHTIKFKVLRKNPSSTDYGFGIDLLKFTPAGGVREGEGFINLTYPNGSSGIEGSSGDTLTAVNTRDLAEDVWSNDYYLHYAANAAGDYLTMRFYYDGWNETIFRDGVADNVMVEFSDNNGMGGASGDEEYLVCLEGDKISWEAAKQTQAPSATSHTLYAGPNNITYRNWISSSILANGRRISLKFCAGANNDLTIQEAYMIQRDESEGGTGNPYDGSRDMPSIPITFCNCDKDRRNDPDPLINPTQTGWPLPINEDKGVTIKTGGYAWSNWIELYDDETPSNPFDLDKAKDYLVSFYVEAFADQDILSWQDPAAATHSFTISAAGSYAATSAWSAIEGEEIVEEPYIYGVESFAVSYVAEGKFASQVFDTHVDNPAYSTMRWTAVKNAPDADLKLRVRTGGTKEELEADGSWTGIPGEIFSDSPASLASLDRNRFVQFRADFCAFKSETSSHITDDYDDETLDPGHYPYTNDEDYDISSVLKDVFIYWPGNTTLVDAAGYFTKRPDYGIFTVEIDGQKLIKGFEITLSLKEESAIGKVIERSIKAEVEPRNTGK